MYCPNCGSQNLIEQNFCRYCGLNLGETANSLAKQRAFDGKAVQLKKLERYKKLSDYAANGLFVLFATAICILIYLILTKAVFSGEKVTGGILAIYFILDFGYRQLRKRKNKSRENIDDLTRQEFEKKATTKLIAEKPSEPVFSVAENSTELLFADKKTKKLR